MNEAGGLIRVSLRLFIAYIKYPIAKQDDQCEAQKADHSRKRQNSERKVASRTHKSIEEVARQDELIAPLSWAQRLRRVFNIDISLCPLCGGTMRVIADITDPDLIQKILEQLEPQPPPIKPAPTIQS